MHLMRRFFKLRINRLKVISEKDMVSIHGASLKILAETGVVFHNEEALAIFKNTEPR